MRTCFVHIGTHKTGTKSIQVTLANHAEALGRSGYLFPAAGRPARTTGQHNIAFELLDDERFDSDCGTIDDLIDEIGSSDEDVILSSEEFLRALYFNPQGFRRLVEHLSRRCSKVVLVAYLRNQVGYIRSAYFERLKSGFALTFEDYAMQRLQADLSEFPLDYSWLPDAIERLPAAGAIYRSYDAVREGGVVGDFVAAVDLPANAIAIDVRANVEQSIAESFRHYFRNRMGRPTTKAEREIIDLVFPAFSGSNLRIADAIEDAVRRKFEPSNEKIAARLALPEFAIKPQPKNSNGVAIDHIFSSEFPIVVSRMAALQERLVETEDALADAQRLAVDRFCEIEKMQSARPRRLLARIGR